LVESVSEVKKMLIQEFTEAAEYCERVAKTFREFGDSKRVKQVEDNAEFCRNMINVLRRGEGA